jgi:hypothetical protein
MTVQYRATSTPVGGTTPTIEINAPAGLTDDDIMLACILANDNVNPPMPGDWDFVDSEVSGSFNISVYSRIASSEPSTYTVTQASTENYCGWIVAFYSDAALQMVVNAHAALAYASSATRTWPGVVTSKASAGLVIFHNSGTNRSSPVPASFAEDVDALINSGNRGYQAHQILTVAGATGDFTSVDAIAIATRAVTVAVAELIPPDGDPTGLGATVISGSRIDLEWTDTSANETGFEIEHSTDGSIWALLHTTAADVEVYSHTGLDENSIHYYRVRAVNADGESGYSNTDNATTTILAPSSLTASPAGATQINLEWTNNSVVADEVSIERSPDGSTGWVEIDTVAASESTYEDVGLSPATEYFYRIRSVVL